MIRVPAASAGKIERYAERCADGTNWSKKRMPSANWMKRCSDGWPEYLLKNEGDLKLHEL